MAQDRPIEGWQTLFLVAGILDVIVVVMFVTLVKAEVQPWAVMTTTTTAETDRLLATSSKSSPRSGYAALVEREDVSDPTGSVMLQQAEPDAHTDNFTQSTPLLQSST